jgi:hypothetical protein
MTDMNNANDETETAIDRKRTMNRDRQRVYRENQRKLDSKSYTAKHSEYKRVERAKARLSTPTPSPIATTSTVGAPAIDKNREAVEELVKTLNKVLDSKRDITDQLPKIREISRHVPEVAQLITDYDDCSDLQVKMASREAEVQRLYPKRKVPSESTQAQTIKSVARLYNLMFKKTFDCKSFEWVRDTDRVLDFINKQPTWTTEGTRNAARSALASILRNLDGFGAEYRIYSELSSDIYKNVISKAIGENRLSASQKKKYLPWEVLTERLEAAWPETTYVARALTSLYVLRPPRRTKDYGLMKVVTKKNKAINDESIKKLSKEFNYLVLDNRGVPSELIFHNYKTKREFGTQTYPVNKELATILKDYIDDEGVHNGDFLFSNDGKPWGSEFSTVVGKFFEELVGKRMSSTLLRHSFISYILDQKQSDNARRKIATEMSHSLEVQATYRVLKDSDENEDSLSLIDPKGTNLLASEADTAKTAPVIKKAPAAKPTKAAPAKAKASKPAKGKKKKGKNK